MTTSEIEYNVKAYIEALNNTNDITLYESLREQIIWVESLAKSDTEFQYFIEQLKKATSYERENILQSYLSKKELEAVKDEKEMISKMYGVDISDINHKILSDGKEIFIFYDKRSGQNRVIENKSKNESLTEQLKEEQNNNPNFQTTNYKENATSILNEQTKRYNNEVTMIYVGEISRYEKVIYNLDKKGFKKLIELLGKKDALGIEYIDITNFIGMDKNGKIYESVLKEDESKAELTEPKSYKYNSDTMDNKEKLEEELDFEKIERKENTYDSSEEELDTSIDFNKYEDLPQIVSDAGVPESEKQTVISRVIKYYENPDEMMKLSDKEREFYEELVTLLAQKIELKEIEANKNVIQLRNEEKIAGFSNILILSIIIVIIAVIIILFI